MKTRLCTSIRGAIGKASLAHGKAYRLKASFGEFAFYELW
jgi:hypothetical protein